MALFPNHRVLIVIFCKGEVLFVAGYHLKECCPSAKQCPLPLAAKAEGAAAISDAICCPGVLSLMLCVQTAAKLYLVLDFVNGGHLFFNLYRHASIVCPACCPCRVDHSNTCVPLQTSKGNGDRRTKPQMPAVSLGSRHTCIQRMRHLAACIGLQV